MSSLYPTIIYYSTFDLMIRLTTKARALQSTFKHFLDQKFTSKLFVTQTSLLLLRILRERWPNYAPLSPKIKSISPTFVLTASTSKKDRSEATVSKSLIRKTTTSTSKRQRRSLNMKRSESPKQDRFECLGPRRPCKMWTKSERSFNRSTRAKSPHNSKTSNPGKEGIL